MDLTDEDVAAAEARMRERVENGPRAVRARYDHSRGRVIVRLDTGVELTFPPKLAQGLEHAAPEQLAHIEITPLGDGLHWPDLDADLYVPSLLQGQFGTRTWMARQLGAAGGRARSAAKRAVARENGRRGGRPRKAG